MCGKIEKLSDLNKNWCGSSYVHCDYDSGDKKTKRQKDKKAKRQKDKKDWRAPTPSAAARTMGPQAPEVLVQQ